MCEKQISSSSSLRRKKDRPRPDALAKRVAWPWTQRPIREEEEDIMTICSGGGGDGSKVCCRRDDDLRYDPGLAGGEGERGLKAVR